MQTCYTYDETTKRLNLAPKFATIDGAAVINPTREQCARMEPPAYPLGTSTPPTPPEGKITTPDGYEPVDTPDGKEWRQAWRYEDAPPPPVKTYSTADAIEALMKAGVYPQCREWIEQRGLLDMMLATKEFRGDDENFKNILEGLQTLLDWTDEQVAEVLAYAEI